MADTDSQCEPQPLVFTGIVPDQTVTGDEVMVTLWPDGTAEIATRPALGHARWSPPSPLRKADG